VNGTTDMAGNRRLLELLDACRDREVWVVGDLMLDEYVQGAVERISPEAPVPVVRVGDVHFRLGGAANVARQVAVLGARAVLAGVVGEDATGEQLVADCARAGIDTRAIHQDPRRRTTRKLRVLGHGQQLVRLDWEDVRATDEAIAADLDARLRGGRPPEVVILSDYAKGVLSDVALGRFIGTAREAGCRVLVDPKRRDLAAYRGASVLTPNLGELSVAAGTRLDPDDREAIAAAARPFVEAAGLEAMLVTLSDRGMLLVHRDGSTHHVPAARRAVSDVTGAGDTAMAVLATTLAAGGTLEQAMEIANTAAGLAVAEVGAVAIEPAQIAQALADIPGGKVLGRRELAARAAGWRAAGKRIVFTNGCYDLLHAGHLSLLHASARLGDVLVLAINSDESVRRLKGPTRPIVPAAERAALLAALSCVDAVTVFEEDTPLETLEAVRPHVLVKGQDYGLKDVVGRGLVESYGGRVELVPLLDNRSTSAIVERIRSGPDGIEAQTTARR
jgi:D-beta-D-heptose 7-phosphate kinase/D-beta-D-heptose 1-phosphate adenosyltransferase